MSKKANGGPAWLATFADLMSLLMALFVLLYAMSSPDAAKYKALVESLSESLGHGAELTPEQAEFFRSYPDEIPTEDPDALHDQKEVSDIDPMSALYEQLKRSFQLSTLQDDGSVEVAFDTINNQIQLVFPEQIAFDRGRADLKPRFRVMLRKFYQFRDEPIKIRVVGHTDSVPITGGRFRSNWELSSARAASVIMQMIADGSVQPKQVEAVGLADTQPIDKANTEEAHAKNRRVEFLITPDNSIASKETLDALGAKATD